MTIEPWDCNTSKTLDWKLQVIKVPNLPHDSGTGGLCDARNLSNPICQRGRCAWS